MIKPLSEYFSIKRRYSRSINLERDLDNPDALEGYILTERAVESTKRLLAGLSDSEANRAWTLTGVYGTGKSAFALFFASLCAPEHSRVRHRAMEIADSAFGADSSEYRTLKESIPSQGKFRAIATAQREPLSNTIIRALYRGAEVFWTPAERSKLAIAGNLVDLFEETAAGKSVDSRQIPSLVQQVAASAKTGVLLIIDELGKNLEFAAHNQGAEDLYLLQQLAELPRDTDSQVYIVGLLHQAFADYGERLASVQRNEWAKIQGRFEDISFQDTSAQMMRLIGEAIDRTGEEAIQCATHTQATEWLSHLPGDIISDITQKLLAAVYPLHPIAALVLPMLCTRYAQNDRSLFTFLTSAEPYSFKNFLEETTVETIEGDPLPTLKLDRIYDYFIEAVGMGLTSRPNFSRWVEVQGLITDYKHLNADSLRVLKTIGTLNLVTTTGGMRATRSLVTMAMCDSASDSNVSHWEQAIDDLIKRNIITHSKILDELRIWEGSDFNVDGEVAALIEQEQKPLVSILSTIRSLTPVVAQRHSYKTGTLRYFERQYLDASKDLSQLRCSSNDCDGLVGYWVDDELPNGVPDKTADGKPLIVLRAANLDLVRKVAPEVAALIKIQTSAPQLQTDGVARREVRYRLVQTEKLLDETLSLAFDVAENRCWIQGNQETIGHVTDFNAKLSDVCDRVYNQKFILWNELINRRELSSQAAKARRELIEAMLERPEQEKLGLQGNGPEVSMYFSVLGKTEIHRAVEGEWAFYPPGEESGVLSVWKEIEDYCLAAKEKQQTLDLLYKQLEAPPYGVKRGAIPVLLAAVLLHRVDDVGVYKDGTFIPVLGAEHFELLVKDPSRFAVKYFEVVGLRSEVFKELESIWQAPGAMMPPSVRNPTLLTVVTPLLKFVRRLPAYTKKTKRLSNDFSKDAVAVLQALQQEQEPDELLFTALPKACGVSPIIAGQEDDGTTAKTLRKKLAQAINEIHTAYDRLLSECEKLLYEAFAVRSSETKLREDLRVRASYLVGQCIDPILRRFILAATDETATQSQWLEALLMIVADKPTQSWTDEDVAAFEIKLADIARRFKNLEALQKEVAAKGEGFSARRITVTRPDGQETHRMVWVEHDYDGKLEDFVEKILQDPIVSDNPQRQEALVAKLIERVFKSTSKENITQMREKHPDRDYEQTS